MKIHIAENPDTQKIQVMSFFCRGICLANVSNNGSMSLSRQAIYYIVLLRLIQFHVLTINCKLAFSTLDFHSLCSAY